MDSEADEEHAGPDFSQVLAEADLTVTKLLSHCDFLDNLEMQTSGLLA
jgi:hypothetical protein